jgi:hypothetical protein
MKHKDEPSALFIPAGICLGLGAGFLYGNIQGWFFMGFGFGLLLFGIFKVRK